MGLYEILQLVFRGEEIGRLDEMIKVLEENNIFSEDDLKYLDEEILERANFFTAVEIKKLLAYKSDPKHLRHALEKIFGKTNPKLGEIETYFNENEVYVAEDLALYDLNEIARNETIFSDRDVLKIKNHIRREHPESFKEILEREENVKKKESIELEAFNKSKEFIEKQRGINLDFLYKKREHLSESLSELHKRFSKLIVCQTDTKKVSIKSPSDFRLSMLPRSGAKPAGRIMGRVTGFMMVASDLIHSCMDMYKCIDGNSNSSKDAHSLLVQLEEVRRDIEDNEQKIQNELDKKGISSCAELSISK